MGKFSNAVDSLGSKTLASIARAGPDTKVRTCTTKNDCLYSAISNAAWAFKDCGFVLNVMLCFL